MMKRAGQINSKRKLGPQQTKREENQTFFKRMRDVSEGAMKIADV